MIFVDIKLIVTVKAFQYCYPWHMHSMDRHDTSLNDLSKSRPVQPWGYLPLGRPTPSCSQGWDPPFPLPKQGWHLQQPRFWNACRSEGQLLPDSVANTFPPCSQSSTSSKVMTSPFWCFCPSLTASFWRWCNARPSVLLFFLSCFSCVPFTAITLT